MERSRKETQTRTLTLLLTASCAKRDSRVSVRVNVISKFLNRKFKGVRWMP